MKLNCSDVLTMGIITDMFLNGVFYVVFYNILLSNLLSIFTIYTRYSDIIIPTRLLGPVRDLEHAPGKYFL